MEVLVAVLAGVLAGVISGVAGVGGGVLMIPVMVFLLSLDQHTAQGTSTLAILFTSVSGTYVNVRNRHADLRTALAVGVGGAVAAYFASRVAVATDADLLQRLFGLLVIYSGVRMGLRAWKNRRRDPI